MLSLSLAPLSVRTLSRGRNTYRIATEIKGAGRDHRLKSRFPMTLQNPRKRASSTKLPGTKILSINLVMKDPLPDGTGIAMGNKKKGPARRAMNGSALIWPVMAIRMKEAMA